MYKKIIFAILIFLANLFNVEVKSEISKKNTHLTKVYFNNKVHVIKVYDLDKIKVVSQKSRENLLDIVKINNAWGGINGGYFNHSDGLTVSKVYINSKLVENPKDNKALMTNKNLKPIMDKILNKRSELRITEYKNQKYIDIVPNDYPLKIDEKIIYSIQAGPLLIPSIDLEKEGFIILDKNKNIIRDGIASSQKASRSGLGITKDNILIFISTTAKSGINIKQLSEILKDLGAIKAMALDGGSSTSMVWEHKKYFSSLGQSLAGINSAIIFTN